MDRFRVTRAPCSEIRHVKSNEYEGVVLDSRLKGRVMLSKAVLELGIRTHLVVNLDYDKNEPLQEASEHLPARFALTHPLQIVDGPYEGLGEGLGLLGSRLGQHAFEAI